MAHLDSLAFILYLDSLFAETRERDVRPTTVLPATLSQLYLQAMRAHSRKHVLQHRRESAWQHAPDWRFDRQVIRLALHLKERAGVAAGDRVAIVSEPRPEWLVADFAALNLGAMSVAIDPGLPGGVLIGALAEAKPRVTFASAAALAQLALGNGQGPGGAELIGFDPAPAGLEGVLPFAGVLDRAGTLDTAERAQAFRAEAGALEPERPAVWHYRRGVDGRLARSELTQGEVIGHVGRHWAADPARPGDVACVIGSEMSLDARLALYAFVGDGYTTAVLTAPERGSGDLAALHPDKIVAPAAVLADALGRQDGGNATAAPGPVSWLRRAATLTALGRARESRRATLEALGGRVRWIGPTDSLDATLAARLAAVAVVARPQ